MTTHEGPEPIRSETRRDPSDGLDPAAARVAAAGRILLGVGVGVQTWLAMLLVYGPGTVPHLAETLTRRGLTWCHPERESPIYIAGCAATLSLVLALNWAWRASRRRRAPAEAWCTGLACGMIHAILSLLSTLAFFAILQFERPLDYRDGGPALAATMLILPGMLALVAGWAAIVRGPGRTARGLVAAKEGPLRRALSRTAGMDDGKDVGGARSPSRSRRRLGLVLDGAAVILVVAIVYVPDGETLAGTIAVNEAQPFFHWDYFAMAPALGFLHGGALGTDVFSQYGVAWPVLFASLDPLVPLNYGNLLELSSLYASLYFLALYGLLRLAFGSRPWALLGVFTALSQQLFMGVPERMTLWCHPSATVLRMPLDVWFFLALLAHLRSGRAVSIRLASAATGLAILFEVDTGVYLAAVLAFYWTCLPGRAGREDEEGEPGRAGILRGAASSAAIIAVTLLTGLAVASRGTLVRPGFGRDWLEGLIVFGGSGMSALPFDVGRGGTALIAAFFLIVVSLLVTVAWAAGRARGREATDLEIFWGCWAAYGLAGLLLFVHRSIWPNLYHASIPIVVLAVAALKRVAQGVGSWRSSPDATGPSPGPRALAALPLALVAAQAVSLAADHHFREYPNLTRRVWHGPPDPGLRLMPGVGGLPPGDSGFVREFRAVVARMAALHASGRTVAVVIPADPMYYLASGCPPRDRYSPLLTNLMTKRQAREAEDRFVSSRFDYAVIHSSESSEIDWYRLWSEFRRLVERDYVLDERIGSTEIWRRSTLGTRVGAGG